MIAAARRGERRTGSLRRACGRAPSVAPRPVAAFLTGVNIFRFPAGFLWGASTASHQVEGDNRWNDWWEFEEAGRLPHRSGEACRHFELYEGDFDLARSFGHNAHRFSIEWSRIEPREGDFDAAALDHYVTVVRALKARGLEPIVTLHHFTNPAWFTRRGGWTRADSVRLFQRYVERVTARLASEVRFWITVNEPTVYVMRAYIAGDWPPCKRRSWIQAGLALRNLCHAHSAAYGIIHEHRPQAMVGLAHSAPYIVPLNAARRADRFAARMRDFALNTLCFRLLGRPPSRVLDFIGINYYVRQVVRWSPRGMAALFGSEHKDRHSGGGRQFSSLGWEVYPQGLSAMLRRFAVYRVPLIVTENGIATSDEALRVSFIEAHVRSLAQAMSDGANVLGYFYWTLFDNYEWTEGRTAHFGLAAVEPSNQRRIARPAARAFEKICRSNSVPTGPTPLTN
jgi:beta-glucosidase